MNRRIVISGLGALTAAGASADAFRKLLAAGGSAIRRLQMFDASASPIKVGAEILDFDPKQFVEKKDRKQLKLMVRTSELAVAAAKLAMNDAGLAAGAIQPDRLGVSFGNAIIPGELSDLTHAGLACYDRDTQKVDLARLGTDGIAAMSPMWMLNHVPNMAACHISILHDARGPSNTLTQTHAASLFALGEAVRILRRGAADVMIVGGSDTMISPVSVVRYWQYGELTTSCDPATAAQPFGLRRSGYVPGEGAGVVIVEELEHAQRRNAKIYGEVLSFSSGFSSGHTSAVRVIREALHRAQITPAELDHVNAHAGGAVQQDLREAQAIHEGLDHEAVPVVALKSVIGSLGTGASIAELVGSLQAMEHGFVPATLMQGEVDPACAITLQREIREPRQRCVLKLSSTDLGQTAAVVVRKWE
jgi:3-oxoacyl-[acyl-carrier-protein] synthase II